MAPRRFTDGCAASARHGRNAARFRSTILRMVPEFDLASSDCPADLARAIANIHGSISLEEAALLRA